MCPHKFLIFGHHNAWEVPEYTLLGPVITIIGFAVLTWLAVRPLVRLVVQVSHLAAPCLLPPV